MGESYDIHQAYLTDIAGHELYSYNFADPEYVVNAKGYVEQITDQHANRVYNFQYRTDASINDALYTSVLNEYQAACLYSKYVFESDRHIFPHVTSCCMNEVHFAGGALMYAYEDIDQNGVSELLIGYTYDPDSIEPQLIDIYTHNGNYPVKFFYDSSIGDEGTLAIYTDGTMAYKGSVHGGVYFENYYKIGEDRFSLQLKKAFEHNLMDGYESVFDTDEYKNYVNALTPIPTPQWTTLPIDVPFP